MKFEIRVKQLRDGSWQARYIRGKVETLDLTARAKRPCANPPLPTRVLPLKRGL